MRSYHLMWDERVENIVLSYTECRKVYIDDIDKINLLVKGDISNDGYHLYTYNNEVKFLIKDIKIENNKIVYMIVYLLSNDCGEIDRVYYKIEDEVHFDIDSLSHMYHYKKENNIEHFFDDRIGIIKNYERCMDNKNLMLSDIYGLNDITKLELRNGYYYLDGNKYLNEGDYKRYVNKYFDEICNGLIDKELYVALRHIGPYDTIYKTYNKLLKLISDEKRKIVGLPMEQFICGRWNEKDENKYVTNVMIPIE